VLGLIQATPVGSAAKSSRAIALVQTFSFTQREVPGTRRGRGVIPPFTALRLDTDPEKTNAPTGTAPLCVGGGLEFPRGRRRWSPALDTTKEVLVWARPCNPQVLGY
jgi:hypothetical protein